MKKFKVLLFIAILVLLALSFKNFNLIEEKLYPYFVQQLVDIPKNEPNVLRIVYTGVSTPLTPHIAQQSVVFDINDSIYVFDVGSRSVANFISQGTLDAANIKAVFITHTHSDHVGGLGELVLASWIRGRKNSLSVYGAGDELINLVDGFNLAYQSDREHRVIHHGDGFLESEFGLLVSKAFDVPEKEKVVFEDDNIKVSAFQVPHGPVKGAVGYRIVSGDRSVILSGDTALMEDYSFVNGVDVLIHEGIFTEESEKVSKAAYALGNDRVGKVFEDIQDYHTNLFDTKNQPGLLSRLDSLDVGLLALIHIIPDKDNFIIKRALKKFKKLSPLKTVIVNDNMVMHLPLNSEKIIIR